MHRLVGRTLATTRFLIIPAVIGTLLASATLLLYGTLVVFEIIIETVGDWNVSAQHGKQLTVDFIVLVDMFLLGTVLYLIGIGLYELFIDDTLPAPDWLHVNDLDDLKSRLISVIVVLLGVTFLGAAVEWQGGKDIMYYGFAIASILIALGFILYLASGKKLPSGEGDRSLD